MAVRGKWWIVAGLILFALLAALAWNWSTLRARAQLGSAYGARLTCSCRYVEGRAMGSCQGDKEPGMAMVRRASSSCQLWARPVRKARAPCCVPA